MCVCVSEEERTKERVIEWKKMLGGAEGKQSILIMENISSFLIRTTTFYHSTNAEECKSVMVGATHSWLIRGVNKTLYGAYDFASCRCVQVLWENACTGPLFGCVSPRKARDTHGTSCLAWYNRLYISITIANRSYQAACSDMKSGVCGELFSSNAGSVREQREDHTWRALIKKGMEGVVR